MKKTMTIYVHQRLKGFLRGELFASDANLADIPEYQHRNAVRVISIQEIEVEVPADDLDLLEIEALEAQVAKERGESQHRVNLLLDRISQLKAIGHEVAA